jgi:3-methyladenine DNA glycosylase AlkD
MKADVVKQALQILSSPDRAKRSASFFKTGPGQYGEGDRFIGVTVPEQRIVAKTYKELPLNETIKLLKSPIHEHRLTSLIILVNQYRRGNELLKKEIVEFYLENRVYINNWDLVDSSAPYILGDYLRTHPDNILFTLTSSGIIWDRRIAILSTFAWIKDEQFDLTLNIATILLNDREDLIHKATGWALREVGKKDQATLVSFLDQYAAKMPRTSLRYAIERLSPEKRQYYMGK